MRVLLVDGDGTVRGALRKCLEDEGSCSVAEVADGREALAYLEVEHADVVIAEVLLPELDGYSLCAAIRRNERLQKLPVLFYTRSFARPDDVRFALAVGADQVLRKPAANDEILRALNHVLRARVARPLGADGHGEEVQTLRPYNVKLIQRLENSFALLQTHFDRMERDQEVLKLGSAALDHAAHAVLITNPEHTIVRVNAELSVLLGYHAEELLGQNVGKLKADSERTDLLRSVTVSAGRPWRGELHLRHKNGSARVVDASIAVIPANEGEVSHYVFVIQDATERKTAEAALRQCEENFGQLTLNIQDVFRISTADLSQIIYVSPGFERIWAGSTEALYRSPSRWADAIVDEDRARVLGFYAGVSRGFPGTNVEYRIRNTSGALRWVSERCFPIRDERGEIYRQAGIATDVTEKKSIENQLFRTQRLESLGNLASGIAHDLNNALAPIMISIDLLRTHFHDSAAAGILDAVAASAKRGADTVNQLLTFGQGLEGERAPMQIGQMVHDIEPLLVQSLTPSVQLQIRTAPDLWPVLADAAQLRQVLLNLCLNAREAMPDGGTLAIKASNVMVDEQFASAQGEWALGPYVLLSVRDTGTGIPLDWRERIFDPFFTTKPPGQATGLGLWTVLAIVRTHGGFLLLDSELGQGSEFKIYLPARRSPETPLDVSPVQTLPVGKGEAILFVDDEEAVRVLSRKTLEAFGYQVVTASDGPEAVALFARSGARIDLVVTDIGLPIMDGVATIHALRSLDPKIRIIACSGLDSQIKRVQRDVTDVSAFIRKPFTAEELLRTVRTVIDSGVPLD